MSNQNKDQAFFIGWEATPAASISAFTKKVTILFAVVGLAIAGVVTALQQTVTSGTFDYGNVQEFSGVLVKNPVPMLITKDGSDGERIYYLVAPFKNGFPADVAETNHLQQVTLKGTFIGDELDLMIEVAHGSVSPAGGTAIAPAESEGVAVTLCGEIVDAKCHLGVMNPGRFKPHRACAIQCISGGIPPILVAKTADGQLAHYLLVGADGSAINAAVIDYVAEPVEVTGTLKTVGGRLVLFASPASISRL